MLRLSLISKIFNAGTVNETTVFDGFNLQIEKGSFVSVVGSNGSGKTTLLNLISGSISPDSGTITLGGRDITQVKEFERARVIGRVFQDPSKGTAPAMTIAENLSVADNKNKIYGLSAGLNKKRLPYYREILSSLGLGLEDKLGVQVGSLSGGQRQALALLMCTMSPIDLLLLDEHTAALDPKTAENIMELTDKIIRQKNITTLMVTHNLKFAANYGTRILMMDKGIAVIDKAGEEKANVGIGDLLAKFNEISIECGN